MFNNNNKKKVYLCSITRQFKVLYIRHKQQLQKFHGNVSQGFSQSRLSSVMNLLLSFWPCSHVANLPPPDPTGASETVLAIAINLDLVKKIQSYF